MAASIADAAPVLDRNGVALLVDEFERLLHDDDGIDAQQLDLHVFRIGQLSRARSLEAMLSNLAL